MDLNHARLPIPPHPHFSLFLDCKSYYITKFDFVNTFLKKSAVFFYFGASAGKRRDRLRQRLYKHNFINIVKKDFFLIQPEILKGKA